MKQEPKINSGDISLIKIYRYLNKVSSNKHKDINSNEFSSGNNKINFNSSSSYKLYQNNNDIKYKNSKKEHLKFKTTKITPNSSLKKLTLKESNDKNPKIIFNQKEVFNDIFIKRIKEVYSNKKPFQPIKRNEQMKKMSNKIIYNNNNFIFNSDNTNISPKNNIFINNSKSILFQDKSSGNNSFNMTNYINKVKDSNINSLLNNSNDLSSFLANHNIITPNYININNIDYNINNNNILLNYIENNDNQREDINNKKSGGELMDKKNKIRNYSSKENKMKIFLKDNNKINMSGNFNNISVDKFKNKILNINNYPVNKNNTRINSKNNTRKTTPNQKKAKNIKFKNNCGKSLLNGFFSTKNQNINKIEYLKDELLYRNNNLDNKKNISFNSFHINNNLNKVNYNFEPIDNMFLSHKVGINKQKKNIDKQKNGENIKKVINNIMHTPMIDIKMNKKELNNNKKISKIKKFNIINEQNEPLLDNIKDKKYPPIKEKKEENVDSKNKIINTSLGKNDNNKLAINKIILNGTKNSKINIIPENFEKENTSLANKNTLDIKREKTNKIFVNCEKKLKEINIKDESNNKKKFEEKNLLHLKIEFNDTKKEPNPIHEEIKKVPENNPKSTEIKNEENINIKINPINEPLKQEKSEKNIKDKEPNLLKLNSDNIGQNNNKDKISPINLEENIPQKKENSLEVNLDSTINKNINQKIIPEKEETNQNNQNNVRPIELINLNDHNKDNEFIYNQNNTEIERNTTDLKDEKNHLINQINTTNIIKYYTNSKVINDNDNQYNNRYSEFPEILCNPNKTKNFKNTILETNSITSIQSRDCSYYKNELQKLSNYIKNYYSENKKYPESNINFYLFGREIGHGAFGKVNLCLHLASGHLVAMKTFVKKELKNSITKERLKNEVEVLSKLHHPFINKILDNFETETHFFIVMEYICGDLLSFIRKRNKLNEYSAKIIFKQIIEGLKYIHKKKIIHRDIKLDNILIDLTNTIKICDFGVSRKIEKGTLIYERCGTPAYIAPEIYAKIGYDDCQSDIWSAGITLYYMLSGSLPFKKHNIQDLEKAITRGEYPLIEGISYLADSMLEGLLQVDPKKRFTIDDILNHPWLKNVNLENRYKLNIFTEAEKKFLVKYYKDYLNSDKNDLIENFTYKNLDIDNTKKKKSGETKSVIYAPYNTCVEDSKEENHNHNSENIMSYLSKEEKALYNELEIKNDICKFGWRVKQANINYELSNNDDFDNGLIRSEKDLDKNKKIEKSNNKTIESVKDNENIPIDFDILEYIENNIGYSKKYLEKCLKKNIVNYSTATYYLLYKDKINGKK